MRGLKDESVLFLLVIVVTAGAYPQFKRDPDLQPNSPWSAAGSFYSRHHSQEPAAHFSSGQPPQARKITDDTRSSDGRQHPGNQLPPTLNEQDTHGGGNRADRWGDESYTVIDEKHLEPVSPHILPFTTHIQYVPVAEIIDKPVISSVKVEHHHPSGSHVSYETREYRPHQVAIKLASHKAPQIHETLKESIISQVVETNPHVYKIPIIHQRQNTESQENEHDREPDSDSKATFPQREEISDAKFQASEWNPPTVLAVPAQQPWPAAANPYPHDPKLLKDKGPRHPVPQKVSNNTNEVVAPPEQNGPPSLTDIPEDLLYGKHSVVSQAFYDVQRQVAPPYVEHKQRYLGPYPFQELPGGGRQLRLTAPSHMFDRTYYGKTRPTLTYMFPDRLYRT